MTQQKTVFYILFACLAIILSLLPFLVSFNDLLTIIVEENVLYVWIQNNIVPLEARMMGVLFMLFGYSYSFSPTNSTVVVNGMSMGISWNCIGWQSFFLFVITLFFGFRGRYTKLSIAQAFVIGILGTFWLNVVRMGITVLLAVHLMPVFRVVFHDYLAAFMSLGWLFFFWWFSYSFVLETKDDNTNE